MILLTASLGGLSFLSFNNGLLLAYFSYLNVPSTTILLLLALMPLAQFVFVLPCQYFAGKFPYLDNCGRDSLIRHRDCHDFWQLVCSAASHNTRKNKRPFFWSPAPDMAVYRNRFNFVLYIHPGAIPFSGDVPGCSGNHLNFNGSPHTVLPANS